MAGKGQTYTSEFRASAIQLALNNEKPIKEIAQDLGIVDKTLYSWLSTYRKKHKLNATKIEDSTPKTSKESLEQENRRLRKELARVTEEREILKKATAYFAKIAD